MKIKFEKEEFEKISKHEQKMLFSETVAGISFMILIIFGVVYTFFELIVHILKIFKS